MTVLVMFVFPLWAIAVLTIDFLVLFALLTESDSLQPDSGSARRGCRRIARDAQPPAFWNGGA